MKLLAFSNDIVTAYYLDGKLVADSQNHDENLHAIMDALGVEFNGQVEYCDTDDFPSTLMNEAHK